MKNIVLSIAVLALSSGTSFAASKALWTCDGNTVEGAGVSETNGGLEGDLSWDCFPGDGICNARAAVSETRNGSGDLVFQGPDYSLVIRTSVAPENGAYQAHLVAKDTVDAADAGRGFTFSQYVTCKEGQ